MNGRTFSTGLLAMALAAGGAARAADLEVDTLVVGGTKRGVEAAVAAARAGERTYLVTPYSSLGEDMAGTLELGFGEKPPTGPLGNRLWHGSSDLAAFDYWPDRKSDGNRWIYLNDWWDRLAEPGRPPSPSDAVLYEADISYRCVLRKPAKVSRLEVIVLETKSLATEGCMAMEKIDRPVAPRWISGTASVGCRIVKGPLAGRELELKRVGKVFDVKGDYYRGDADAVSFAADIDGELGAVELKVRKHPDRKYQFISRIWFHLSDPQSVVAPPSPLKVRRTFDRALIDAGVGFMTSSPVRRVLRDGQGALAGVEIVNRSGRRTIRAKRIVDATANRALTPTAGAKKAGEREVSRIVIAAGDPPKADGLKVEKLDGSLPISHSKSTGAVYRCTARLPMKDMSYPSRAAAEWEMRERTWTSGMLDDADLLVWKDVEADPDAFAGRSWGEYDVVVVGGGTAGAPAAIAAARAGAKTLLVEYRHVLGGTGTDGMILGYYDGNHCGLTERFKEQNKLTGARFGLYPRAETWRRWCREAGVTVWLGAMGTDAIVEDGKVTGVEVSTAFGCGVVKAKCVIDGTGNSDVAACAGAKTVFLSHREFALQSAGQAPHRIGRGGINSDFGFVDDSNADDLWLFGLRARAGAPDAWDIAALPDSRERRRVVADYTLNAQDVTARRPFPDTVVQARSRQDSHGYLTDDFRFLSEQSAVAYPGRKETRWCFDVNVPLRSLTPKGLSGLVVVGLGAGCARDVVPIVRMQADLMNMGYSVGLAAAMAAANGGDFRTLDFKALRAKLVDEKILREETLGWDKDVDVSSDALIAASVRSMADGFKGSHVVCRPENRARAIPLLREAYAKAETPAARQIYAKTLGLFGDAAGAATLADIVDGREKIVPVRKTGSFGGGGDLMEGFMIALGRTRDPRAVGPLLKRLEAMNPAAPIGTVRSVTLALEALGSPAAAPGLAKCLEAKVNHGFAVSRATDLPPQGGYGLGPEMDNCIRELAFARALWACGDHEGLAKRTLEAYARDPRGVLSAHAKAVLGSR